MSSTFQVLFGLGVSSPQEHTEILRSVRIFRWLAEGYLDFLSQRTRVVTFGASETVLRMGEPSRGLLVVLEGELERSGADQKVQIISKGQIAGEYGLSGLAVSNQYKVRALTAVRCLDIPKRSLEELFLDDESARFRFINALCLDACETYLLSISESSGVEEMRRNDWIVRHEMSFLPLDQSEDPPQGKNYCFLANGAIDFDGQSYHAPSLISVDPRYGQVHSTSADTCILWLGNQSGESSAAEAFAQGRRQHVRFSPGALDTALIQKSSAEGAFVPDFVALILDEAAMGGCGLIVRADPWFEKGKVCYVKLGAMAPYRSEIVWLGELSDKVFHLGIRFVN